MAPGRLWDGSAPLPHRATTWLAQAHHPGARPELDELLPRIAALHTAGSTLERPSPGSALALDDAALDPYRLSHAARAAVGVALDNLEAFRALTVDLRRTHPWAHHVLLRAAIETASTAVWLVQPDSTERRHRRLRLAAWDVQESGNAQHIHGLKPPSGLTKTEILAKISALRPDDRSVTDRLSFRGIVRLAAPSVGVKEDTAELIWRALSGMAHGFTWASLGMLERDVRPTDEPGVMTMRLTVGLDQLLPYVGVAVDLVEHARARIAQLSVAPSTTPAG